MLGIKITVQGNEAKVTEKPRYLTAGTVGLPVEFTLDEQWDGLDKLAVFQAGHQIMTKEASGTVVTVPWEVMKRPNVWLSIGIYGIAQDGSVAIPTIWANIAVIYPGANPIGDPALDPNLPIWKELKNDNEAIHRKLDELNELKGEKGDTPVKGEDYFTEEDIASLDGRYVLREDYSETVNPGNIVAGEENEGKFLRVVGGVAAWSTVPSAGGVDF